MPDKSDIYFVIGLATTLLLGYREIEHHASQWREKRRKRKPRHRRK